MEVFQCASISELYAKVGPAKDYLRWLVYLERKDEIEIERLKAMYGKADE